MISSWSSVEFLPPFFVTVDGPLDHASLRNLILENQEKEKSRRSSIERVDSVREKKKMSPV